MCVCGGGGGALENHQKSLEIVSTEHCISICAGNWEAIKTPFFSY